MLGYYFTDPTHKLEDIDLRSFFADMSDERRERYWNLEERYGTISPREDNVFVEAGQAFMGGVVGALEGVGATANELGLGGDMQDYFRGVLNRNQQWNAPENMSVATYIARAVGNAGGSMAGQAAANYAGTVIGTAATGNPVAGRIIGFGSGLTVGFAQTFGNNVQRNREAGYGEGKSYGMAFLESTIDSTIENLPFGIVGKSGKLATNAGRVMRISQAGKSELLKLVGKKMSAEIGQEATQNLLFQWGKKTIKDGLGEAGEEGLQYLNSYVNQKLGGDPDAEFSINELADAIAQGFIGGFILGGPRNISEVRQENRRSSTPATNQSTVGAPQTPVPAVAGAENAQTTPAVNTVNPLMDEVIRGVGEEFGVKVDYIDNYKGNKKLESADGFYDHDTNTIYLDRNDVKSDPGLALGHEFKHLLDKHFPELVKVFDDLWESGQTEEGKAYFQNLMKELKVPKNEIPQEMGAEVFGMIFKRPGTMKAYVNALNQQNPGMGEKFIQTLVKFFEAIKKRLAGIIEADPEAEALFNNVAALEAEAGKILAEVRRRNGTSSQVENVIGAKGNTAVETVPVEEAGIAPQEVVSETEKTTEKLVAKENLTTEKAESNALQKMREAFANRAERLKKTGKGMLWTDIAREYADGKVLSKEADDLIINEIADMSMEDYQNSEVNNILHAIANNPIHSVSARSRAKSALKSIGKKRLGFAGAITLDSTKTVAEMIAEDENLWEQEKKRYPDTDPSKSVFKQRLDYLKSLSEKEIVEHDVLVKEEKGETAATPEESSEVEETPEVKSAYANLKDRSVELGFTFDKFYEKYAPQLDAIIAKASNQFRTLGDEIVDDWRSAAYEAMAKAYMGYNPQSGVKISTYATKAVVNAINEVNRKHKAETIARGGRVSLDQTNAQGEALSEAVADENAAAVKSKENKNLENDYRKWKSTLKPKDQKILDLSESGLSPSEIGRAAGIGMSTQAVHTRLKELAIAARTEGELQFMRKRGTDPVKGNLMKFFGTIDQAIKSLYQMAMSGARNKNSSFVDYAKISDQEKMFLESKTSLDLSGIKYHAIDESGIRHIDNLHGVNGSRLNEFPNQIPVTEQDYLLIPDIVKSENVSYAGKDDMGQDLIKYEYHNGDTFYYLEEVRVGRQKLSGKTFYKTRGTPVTQVQQNNVAQPLYTRASTTTNIPQSSEKSSDNLEFMRKRLRQQINPIVRDGKVRDEYADLLANKEYTPTTLKELQDKALEWILRRGGIVKAAQDILANKAPADPAVAEIARRYILNSDVFVNGVEYKDRIKLYSLEQNIRSNWGRAGRAMQLAALSLKDVASVQALLNKLHKDIPSEELQKLRNEISKVHGIDIFALPQNIVEDKNLLDAVLRAHLAHKAKWHDKLYEYWINAILSGPGTHISNFFGNTANAVYELGIKRFTEALVNIAAGRKDGATFGEFKAMIKAFNWSNACKAFVAAKNIEVLDPSGKFLENNLVAIGGKTGRIIRYPGRFLKAADAFAKALIQPMETAAYAYRMGVQKGLTGTKLQEYIQNQLTDKDSKAYQWANERAKELTFQEDPGSVVKWLMAMKESDGAMGIILRMFLPFLKTPANILRQGVRKGPLGIFNLAWETGKLALGKREFDAQYVARVAEQLLAWGTVMLFLGLDDEDDLPFITGSSAPYGSAEYGFKGNKIPPYSIRIGGSYYSYQRIEPFATSLALIADGIQALRNIKNGKDGTAVLNDVWRGAKQIVVDKSFFSTLGEINTALTSPDYIFRPVNNIVSGFVPKVVSQPLQALVPEVGESKSRNKGLDFIEDQFFLTLNRAGIMAAIPKVDYFGRDLQKDDWGDSFLSALGRLTSLKRITPDSHMDQAERLIWNYNQKNPDSEYYPSIPQHTFTHEGEQYYLAGKDYHDFAVEAGELAHRQILNAVNAGRLNVANPSEQDIELIKNIFTRARRETRQKYINRAKLQR